MATLRDRAWYTNKAGTRYVRDKAKPMPERSKPIEVSDILKPFLTGEVAGDLTLAILIGVRGWLSDPKRWNPATRAMGLSGPCEPTCSSARTWSIHGSVAMFTDGLPATTRREALAIIQDSIPADDPFAKRLDAWEQDVTHSKMLWVLNMAIGNRKKQLGY